VGGRGGLGLTRMEFGILRQITPPELTLVPIFEKVVCHQELG